MNRERDLDWFEQHREELARQYPDQWIVVLGEKVHGSFRDEQGAVEYALTTFGLDVASVFPTAEKEPFTYIGALSGRCE
jgi:hypothetical protein